VADWAIQRDTSRWLPLAMADLLAAVSDHPPTPEQLLRRWGLRRDADLLEEVCEEGREAAEDAALKRFFGG
jgi:hypothetical protein